jgi:photosystem II stability/assembly factor-like uncharacterized protein
VRAPALRFELLLTFAAVCGCARTNDTALAVSIDSDLPASQIDHVGVVVKSGGDEKSYGFPITGTTSFPIRIGIVPRGKPDFTVEVTATASQKEKPVVSQSAVVQFAAGAQLPLALRLGSDCVAVTCPDPAQTCNRKACVPKTQLAPPPPDAGTDASPPSDASPPPSDGPPRDAGVLGQWRQVMAPVIPDGVTLSGVWPVSGDDVWVVGWRGAIGVAYHFDGTTWTAPALPAGTPALYSVWADAAEVWAVGFNGTVLRRTEGGFQQVMAPTAAVLTGIWGFSATNIWVVGRDGTVLRWDGMAWQQAATGVSGDLLAVAGVAGGELWVVGTEGAVFRYTPAGGWRRQLHALTQNHLYAVWALSGRDVWAVGERAALHYDGTGWSNSHALGTPESSYGVWGSGSDDVWAVGGGAFSIARWNGGEWTKVASPSTTTTLQRVRGLSAREVWAVGNDGLILRFVPGL